MLDKELFREKIAELNVLYPNWKVDITDKKTVLIWYEQFKNCTDAQFEEMVQQYIDNNKFPPTIAGIKEYDSGWHHRKDYKTVERYYKKRGGE